MKKVRKNRRERFWIKSGLVTGVLLSVTIRSKCGNGSGLSFQSEIIGSGITEWWDRNYAFVIFFILIGIIAFLLKNYELSRIKLKNNIKLANLEARKLKEIDLIKSRFLANISHELKTPLSLIKGPMEDIIEKDPPGEVKSQLLLMQKNTDRLNILINQLLDLSRLETSNYTIKLSRGDIISLVKGVINSSELFAGKKNIDLSFVEYPSLRFADLHNNFYFDNDVVEKIIFNLLSNAVKFTPRNGRICVSACFKSKKGGEGSFIITIEDTGIGIPKDKLHLIYNRFYKVDDSAKREHEGFGVGLSYVKELVDVHRANISVMSKPGKGSAFKVSFPLGLSHFTEKERAELNLNHISEPGHYNKANLDGINMIQSREFTDMDNEKPVILIVEDNTDLRTYLMASLQNSYKVLEAKEGVSGMDMALEIIPDLVICDIMMPGMDGYEYTKKIKSDFITCHIPVIILTALTDHLEKIQGLETGADDYLTKPFNSKELKQRIKNLIDNRRMLRRKFGNNSEIRPGEISVTSRDRTLIEKLLDLIGKNIDNGEYTIENLAREAGMSHSQLHRKLKAIVNQSAVQFMRSVKMHRAKELIEKDAGNISEVAYMVGFNDPGYFSKTFRTFFGVLPSQLKKKKTSVM